MKNRFKWLKTAQLILLLAATAAGLTLIFTDDRLYQMIGSDPSVRALCALLWLVLGLSYLAVLMDFRTLAAMRRDYRELDYAVYNDRVAGIANRFSCDAMIEKYMDRPVPDTVGCVMLDLTNIRQINDQLGHLQGNQAIQSFSDMLHGASLGLCFVGRNGGTKFLALFENCDESTIPAFLDRVRAGVERYNARTGEKIEYRWGEAFREGPEIATIHRLVALSDRRLREKADRKGDEHGPSGR